MARYTYTLNPERRHESGRQTYQRGMLEKMTVFQLKEICRRERLVIPSGEKSDREGLIRWIMRFRGQQDYRHLITADEEGLARIQDFLNRCPMKLAGGWEIRVPGTIVLYRETGLDELDGEQAAAVDDFGTEWIEHPPC